MIASEQLRAMRAMRAKKITSTNDFKGQEEVEHTVFWSYIPDKLSKRALWTN